MEGARCMVYDSLRFESMVFWHISLTAGVNVKPLVPTI